MSAYGPCPTSLSLSLRTGDGNSLPAMVPA
ncbi:Uncharacterised protein [Bordetella pertussis]|nr:Uncharacterised protein [Bordetella pertussis]